MINLHTIFSYIVGDDTFLSKKIEINNTKGYIQEEKKKNKFNLMVNMITEYTILSPYQTQNYSLFPLKMKKLLLPSYKRIGIKNLLEKDLNVINISFLNSLNMVLRPEIHKMNIDDQQKNLNLLETFIYHKINRNYKIDKTKNTKKVQAANKMLINNLQEGKISNEIILAIINIFEINLIIFDLNKLEISTYLTQGTKYPYFNPFRDIYFLSYIQGNYEPIISEEYISEEEKQKIYLKILIDSEIKHYPSLNLSINSLIYLSSWNIDNKTYITIVEKFFNKSFKPF